MNKLKFLTFLLLISVCSISQAVEINGREWRQVTDTLGISWNQVSTVCSSSTGVCNGSLGSVSFDTWKWAGVEEISGLFNFFNPAFTGPLQGFSEFDSEWAPRIFNYFEPTFNREINGGIRNLDGISRTLQNPLNAYRGLVSDRNSDFGMVDTMVTNFFTIGLNSAVGPGPVYQQPIGHWLYRDLPSTEVPEPSTCFLMGLGLFGIAYTRRKTESQN